MRNYDYVRQAARRFAGIAQANGYETTVTDDADLRTTVLATIGDETLTVRFTGPDDPDDAAIVVTFGDDPTPDTLAAFPSDAELRRVFSDATES